MSLLGFDIGVRALLTAQSRMETIGHNLANATTPGYSRQSVLVSASTPQTVGALLHGAGVQADAIQRAFDAVLNGRLSQQMSALGRLDAGGSTLMQIETLLGGTSETGPAKLLEKMFASFSALATAADDGVLRSSAVQSASAFAGRVNQLAGDVQSLKHTVASQLEIGARRVNELASRISVLNREIVNAEASSSAANDLRDQREQALRELSSHVDVRAIEDDRGGMRVLVGGRMLVSPSAAATMSVAHDTTDDSVSLRIGGEEVEVLGGQIGGLLSMSRSFLPKLAGDVDAFARNLIYEVNRAHSTGVALDGPFQALRASHALVDQDGDGNVDDELLANAGLPFEIEDGELIVNVTDRASGDVETHRIAIDTQRTTVGDFLDAVEALPHVTAQLDARGTLRMQADAGFGFDFAKRLESAPDAIGSFGGGRASLGTGDGPFALADGDTLDFSGTSGNFSVAFQAGDFANIGVATADEVARVLNADVNFAANGLVASSVGGALVVQTVGAGATQSFTLQGGTAAGAFGWSAGQIVNGSDVAATPTISGAYSGSANGALVFRPNIDGTIGTTAGLVVEVFDANGNKLTDLQVGTGYQPGDELEVVDGVKVAFAFGHLSATDGDVFQVELTADSDSAKLLPALGLNNFFDGLDASTLAVRGTLLADPDQLAASMSGASGDASNLLRMLESAQSELAALDGNSLDERLAQIVGDVGFELQTTSDAYEAERLALDSLGARREQISGVNTDEELVALLEQQQAYAAAAQFLRVVSEITNELLDIV